MSENTSIKINLRELDDVSCAVVVVSRQIRHLIKKNPSFSDMTCDCWVHGGHYTRFKYSNDRFYWYSDNDEPHLEGLARIDNRTDCLCTSELCRLVIFTFRDMCNSLNGEDIEDTPEDLLASAEAKLQEMLNDDSEFSDNLK